MVLPSQLPHWQQRVRLDLTQDIVGLLAFFFRLFCEFYGGIGYYLLHGYEYWKIRTFEDSFLDFDL
jgi:hypothetical protein